MTAQNRGGTLPPCESCGGTQVGDLSVKGVGMHPARKTLWGQPLTGLTAVVCLNCGLTKLLASQLAAVRSEASEHPENFRW